MGGGEALNEAPYRSFLSSGSSCGVVFIAVAIACSA